MSRKNISKKKAKSRLVTRKGIALVTILAVMILVVNIVIASYSWFKPLDETHNGMGYQYDTALRSEYCTFVTYAGTKQADDTILYNENAPISGTYPIPASSGNTQNIRYFKTKITNHDKKFPSNVSLYFESMPAETTLAVTFPSNTVRSTGTSSADDFYVIRNAYVKVNVDTDADGPGLLEVEWFVKTTAANTSLDFSKLYLMYN